MYRQNDNNVQSLIAEQSASFQPSPHSPAPAVLSDPDYADNDNADFRSTATEEELDLDLTSLVSDLPLLY